MEYLAVAQATLDAAVSVVSGIVKLVKKIQEARRLVKNLPQDIEDLLKDVGALQPIIESIESGSPDEHGLLKPHLDNLQAELGQASHLMDDFKKKLEQETSSTPTKVVNAALNRGDARRRKEIEAIRGRITSLREDLQEALIQSTHLTGESTHKTVESTHKTVESTHLTVESTLKTLEGTDNTVQEIHTIAQEMHLKVDALRQIKSTVTVSAAAVTPPPIIAKLDGWARLCAARGESYKIHYLIWDDKKKNYCLPDQGNRREASEGDEDQEGETKRGAREGGWEVENSAKIQFQIELSGTGDRFFYVLSYEMPLAEPTNLQLFFPKYSTHRNSILFPSKRRFPDTKKYKTTDPSSCKVDKSIEALRLGVEGQVVFYLVLSAEPLVQLDEEQEANINDLIEHLTSAQGPGEGGRSFFVKRFLFDVR